VPLLGTFDEMVAHCSSLQSNKIIVKTDAERHQASGMAQIDSSLVWDTCYLTELIYNHINRQFVCGKFRKHVIFNFCNGEGVGIKEGIS